MDHDRSGADLTGGPALAGIIEATATGCRLIVRLTPRSSQDAVEGIERLADGRAFLKARVRAVPEKGKANTALVKLLAAVLKIPASSIAISAGSKARLKTVHVAVSAVIIETRLAALIS